MRILTTSAATKFDKNAPQYASQNTGSLVSHGRRLQIIARLISKTAQEDGAKI
jgi:hypothetical protein